jgi:flagellar hook-length control protein FliK
VSSVASGSSVVASLRSFQTTRGPSAPADNTAEHTTPFSMLLDANNPSVDLKPAPTADRSARADSRPEHNPPAANNQPADATPAPAQKSAGTTDSRCGKAKDDNSNTGNAADDAKGTADGKDGTSATDQNTADSTSACGQAASAQITAGPAIAPVPLVTDTTTIQTADSSNCACVAPATTPPAAPVMFSAALDGAIPSDPATATQDNPDGKSTDSGIPAPSATVAAPAAKPAEIPTPATPATAIATSDLNAPTDGDASAEVAGDGASATPPGGTTTTTPAEPAKKAAAAATIAAPPVAETSAPATDETAAAAANSGPNAKPVLKVASVETGAPTSAKDKAHAISQNGGVFAQTDPADSNANPAATAANGDPAKNGGTKSEGETANGHARHTAAEQISSIAPKPESSSQIADLAAVKINTDTPPALNSSLQAPQVIAPAQTIAPPAFAAVAAIPLAALPVAIAAHAKDGINRFEIRLDPPELGRIDVRLDIDRSGHVTSRLMVERPETLDLLRRDAPQIERTLQDAGLKTSDQGMQFSLRDQTFADHNDSPPSAASLLLPQDDIVPLEAMRQGYGRLIGLGGGIDVRV